MKKIIYLVVLLISIVSCKEEAKKEVTEDTIPQETETSTVKNTEYPENVYWGDQHVHTSYSGDAAAAGTVVGPEEAVRFARGETVNSNTGQDAKLERALDWVVVSDHSDGMGTLVEIKAGNPEMLADPVVKGWYDGIMEGGDAGYQATRGIISAQASKSLPKIMMDPKWARSAWDTNVDIMEKYNEPGTFTAFIGYEWTSNGEVGQNLHRNVVFREGADKTREFLPLTTFSSAAEGRSGTDPESLWAWLDNWESKTGGHALAIPHNGNMSNGWMFRLERYDGSPLTKAWAEARARWEVLYEIYQYKGASETHPSLSPNDEFANFEIWDTSDLAGNIKPEDAIKYEYIRQALQNGLALEKKFGVNPFKYGIVSGTDTHTGLSSGAEEDNYWGKFPVDEPSAERWGKIYKKEKGYVRKAWTLGANGITGVWATSNTREAIWDAMKRRETYASSGPRIAVRLFAGYDFNTSDASGNIAESGYAKGVPMGSDLKTSSEGKSPKFLFAATKDPQGANLDRIQIVKGWLDTDGKTHEKIYDVKWSGDRTIDAKGKLPAVGNTVDMKTAKYTNDIGASDFVGVFEDPDFDPQLSAFYYARVIEIPTPRWTLYDAVNYNLKMDKDVTMIIQERAVSSPIWYNPK
ncbi:DUF3604 domain-containing protein [Tamlana sp. 2_MG-2023]|uniref:DUF3604 domain-containing protein n=1 Tax=unclassified Tamlana TaxID=2614803 RepID=UPI0026E24DD5|nr:MULTISPECIES: DUF3604 domain-containing protein [unclassified Tamlana]MDO6761302.1 DUF3604 domain-containing protein [Tamlana sp. 2_MG-2023]MDO6791785.1 DUF3604 domain-containing protein [Tamlana sp. 1_MG-2023]